MKSFDPTWGGPGTYTIELANRMVSQGTRHEFVFVYPEDVTGRAYPSDAQRPANVREIGTPGRRGVVWDQVTLAGVAKREGFDLLFSPFMSIPLRGRYPKIFTIHGAERYVVPDMLPLDQQLRWMVMDRLLVHEASRIVAVSETMARDYCAATHCDPAKVRAIPLGVGAAFHPIADQRALEATRERLGLPPQFLLFVGRIFPNKNFGNLVKALAKVREQLPLPLVVAGGVRWKYEKDLAVVQELGLTDQIMFLDFVTQQDLVHLYNLARCFVYPSFYESFGLAQVEAMACGCPVVAANTGALPEIAGDAAAFCDPHDPSDIARAILGVAGDDAVRSDRSARGLARASEYTWERCARETLGVLEEFEKNNVG